MTRVFRRFTNVFFAVLLPVFSINLSGVLTLHTAHAANEGTLKVHEKGSASGTESNDPKVCAFNFEGFDFDPAQEGQILIETQPGGVDSLTIPFGPADNVGYAETDYINDGGAYVLANGQYKSTLYGKDANGNYTIDLKAKSKVFKVDCTAVTPTAPTENDECDIVNDTYTIPSTTGVNYQINGQTIAAGTYPGTGSVTITAVAQAGYVLTDTTSWTFTFDATPCPIPVTPAEPTMSDPCGTGNDTYTIPLTDHVSYQINGQTIAAGTYPGTGSVTITAVADNGYVLSGTITWTFDFTDEECDEPDTPVTPTEPIYVDLCGTENDTYTIPSTTGVNYQINGQTIAAGTYPGTGSVTITAVAQAGYVLVGTSSWTFDFTNEECPSEEPCEPSLVRDITLLQVLQDNLADDDCPPGMGGGGGTPEAPETPKTPDVAVEDVSLELPQTGTDQLQKLWSIVIAGITAYGLTYFIVNRRDMVSKK